MTQASSPANLFELIRQKYLKESMIKDTLNEEKCFPFENTYINLTIVESKEQHEKENELKQQNLSEQQFNGGFLSAYKEIYDAKILIDIKDIFKKCKDATKKILVLGRAGIGKSTFCQYVAYQWAKGNLWPKYDLVVLVDLRRVTEDRYPKGEEYSPFDIVKKEYLLNDIISKEEQQCFNERCKNGKVLWILDGYDELAQNIPPYLNTVFNYICETQHHILTSHPSVVALSYDVKMKIIGFTDDNIINYVESFFHRIKDNTFNPSVETKKILQLLKSNPNIWDSAHIPANLELICSIWATTDWSRTKLLTLATLYDNIVEWVCRRYLTKQNIYNRNLGDMQKQDVSKECDTLLKFLECLAFKAMESDSRLLSSQLFKEAKDECEGFQEKDPSILNFGILKSYDDKLVGEQIPTKQQYYFVHLSFQEYFAARHLANLLKSSDKQKATDFINKKKYVQRFRLVFIFAAGLLAQHTSQSAMQLLWNAIQEEPLDQVELQHIKLIIEILNEIPEQNSVVEREVYLKSISQWIIAVVTYSPEVVQHAMEQSLQQAPNIVSTKFIQHTLARLVVMTDCETKFRALRMVAKCPLSELSTKLIAALLATVHDPDENVQIEACHTLIKVGEKAATNDVIAALMYLVYGQRGYLRSVACKALGNMGEKAATSVVIAALRNAACGDEYPRKEACAALAKIGEKHATHEVIAVLLDVIHIHSENRKAIREACEALARMGQNAAIDAVIAAVLNLMRDQSEYIVEAACETLGNMKENAATKNVIAALLNVMYVRGDDVIRAACKALEKIGKKGATNDVIAGLVNAMGDGNGHLIYEARKALVNIGEKGATNDVIAVLLDAIHDNNEILRKEAWETLKSMGKIAATSDVIAVLLNTIHDKNQDIRKEAWETLRQMHEKAATSDVIATLLDAIRDTNKELRKEAYVTLQRIGEKAATNDVIAAVLNRIHNEDEDIRSEAYLALGQMGEKAATDRVIATLLNGINDKDWRIQAAACWALGNMGAKTATNEIIAILLDAVRNTRCSYRAAACRALGNIGEKGEINDVIAALLKAACHEGSIIRDPASAALMEIVEKGAASDVIAALLKLMPDGDLKVRRRTCEALGAMGKKAATNDVITALLKATDDKDYYVQEAACVALGKMSEKDATIDTIAALLKVIRDGNESSRKEECKALDKMIGKSANNDVIGILQNAVFDEKRWVRVVACKALGNIDENSATTNVIAALLKATGDKYCNVRKEACKAMGKVVGEGVTTDVITALLKATRDQDQSVKEVACEALINISEKVMTDDVIAVLMDIDPNWHSFHRNDIERSMELTISLNEKLKNWKSEVIEKVFQRLQKYYRIKFERMRPDHLLNAYLDSGNEAWLSLLAYAALVQGIGITVVDNKIAIYHANETIECCIPRSELKDKLLDVFKEGKRKLKNMSATLPGSDGYLI
ncbi:unnamed protein product [Adineta steineri]|uniref:NACHT domain-containing protein n=1 Tax=Adineta steineri TaxID=433720 RepID=A0A814QYX0_9BILA|nr:unnamed protein product [Adineta steineri]CAF1125654.1 unnamed protein product [Adineta steineri]